MSPLVITLVLLAAGFYVGWNIGANDAANCIGTMVGAQIMPFRRAALLMGLFVILGGVLQGHHVMKTVGKGIVITSGESYRDARGGEPPPKLAERFPEKRLPDLAVFVALLSAGLFVTMATFTRIPVSTSQAIVGGVAGVGVGIVGFDGAFFKLAVLKKIVGCWVLSPILSMTLAFVFYLLLGWFSRKVNTLAWTRVLSVLVIVAACYVSYSLGANDVGNAIGPLLNKYPAHGAGLALLGGVAMAVGALTFGRRVTETVGKNITPLDLGGAFAAQASAAFGVHFFSMLGIPVSTSQAVVGAVIGVGLTKGLAVVSGRNIAQIVGGWVLAPTGAALFSCLTYRLILWIMNGTNP
ncbi:MAG: inorganic phosphate transporter [Akkermansiaceae bacterium]|nr:inorganic phosphate transporter [Akkermansiaceae bacterium]NNM28229.1 inorganic phosphate transporter [Akkermansiaceae bacterium]